MLFQKVDHLNHPNSLYSLMVELLVEKGDLEDAREGCQAALAMLAQEDAEHRDLRVDARDEINNVVRHRELDFWAAAS